MDKLRNEEKTSESLRCEYSECGQEFNSQGMMRFCRMTAIQADFEQMGTRKNVKIVKMLKSLILKGAIKISFLDWIVHDPEALE